MTVKIDQAFTSAFIAAAYGLPIAHENLPYVPTAGTPYAELIIAQNDQSPLSITDSNETTGVFRVILRYPLESGSIGIKTMGDTIATTFKIGTLLTYAGQSAKITRVGRDVGFTEAGWYKIVLTFTYWAYIAR